MLDDGSTCQGTPVYLSCIHKLFAFYNDFINFFKS